jgi:hypothetical protein
MFSAYRSSIVPGDAVDVYDMSCDMSYIKIMFKRSVPTLYRTSSRECDIYPFDVIQLVSVYAKLSVVADGTLDISLDFFEYYTLLKQKHGQDLDTDRRRFTTLQELTEHINDTLSQHLVFWYNPICRTVADLEYYGRRAAVMRELVPFTADRIDLFSSGSKSHDAVVQSVVELVFSELAYQNHLSNHGSDAIAR